MYVEYNWTACRYQFRFGDVFTSVNGYRSAADMREVESILKEVGLKVGKQTASRTWEVVAA